MGELLSQQNYQNPSSQECAAPATELIVQLDGGHILVQDKQQRSFEALSAVIYRPEQMRQVDKNHRQIIDKTCAVSAVKDKLKTIKAYVINAALKQGISAGTKITGLADGALNCWLILLSLQPHCQSLECILDWFHIGKKFQNVNQALGEDFEKSLESAKWELWHGKTEVALAKLALIRENLKDLEKKAKLKGLSDYLQSNQDYLVNYEQRQQAGQTFTSQVAESHIESLINARHKRIGKMQWTREGAHQVLQIRATMASNQWEEIGTRTVLSALVA